MTENPSPLFYWSFFSVFCLVYTLGYTAIFQNWNPKHRPEASSCLISLLHGTPAAIMAVTAITDSSTFLSSNSFFQSIVLDYSIAYFTVDLLHYLLFYPQDYLFMAHHVATLFVFITCRHVAFHGAFSLLVLLLLAEVTSFFQNIWTLAKMKREESAMAAKLYDFISPSFFSLYTVMRGFLGPVFFYKMSRFYLGGEAIGVISWWVSFSWICVVGAAISVSILWIVNQWAEFFRERMIREKEKSC